MSPDAQALHDAVFLGGLIDAAYVLFENEDERAANAMLPVLDAARRMASELANELDRLESARRTTGA